jgi:hypothetical protein
MSSFNVVPEELAVASNLIAQAAAGAETARSASASAAGQAGAFGGEPIEGTFSDMCTRARSATDQLERTLISLAHCVAGASNGYLVTEQGIVRASAFPGQIGTGGPGLSTAPPASLANSAGPAPLSSTPPASLGG